MKQQAVQLKLTGPVLQSQWNGERSLWEMVSDLRGGRLHIPFHQREFVWPQEKQEGFVDRLISGVLPVGVIVTYQVSNSIDLRVYINDGNQRLNTLLRLVLQPEKFGLTFDFVEELLRAVQMPVQHRIYDSHAQAFDDYQGLNWGTPLTPYEFHKGALTTLADYETVWKPLVTQVHQVMMAYEGSIVSERRGRNRKQVSSVARDELATFYRFISGSAARNDLQIARTGRLKDPVFEWDLRKRMEEIGPDKVKQEIERYQRLIERETALVRSTWHTVMGKPNETGVNLVTYRWLMCAAVWRKNADISVSMWAEFVEGALRGSAGRGRFDVIDDGGVAQIVAFLAYNDLTKLDDVCRHIGSDMVSHMKPKRPRRNVTTRPGNDDSHRLPFSTHGHGETFAEPASLNRARGARPVEAVR